MSEENPSGNFSESRRDFLRGLGVTVGGAAIGGGGIGTAFGQGAIPSGYTFHRVLTMLPPFLHPIIPPPYGITNITPGVFLGSFNSPGSDPGQSVIFFHGTLKDGDLPAVFRMVLRFRGHAQPTIETVEGFLSVGGEIRDIEGVPDDQLPLKVNHIGAGSGNVHGNYATSIIAEDPAGLNPDGSLSLRSLPGIYLFRSDTKKWESIARCGDPSPDGAQYGGIMGDVVLHDDNSVTLVAATTKSPSGEQKTAGRGISGFIGSQILAHVDRRGRGDVLLQTGDMLPRTHAMIESFGLIDAVKGRNFIAQVNARRIDVLGSRPGTAVVRGRVKSTGNNRMDGVELLSASPHLLPNSMLNDNSLLVGESILGPRIGRAGRAAVVTHDPRFSTGVGELEKHRLTTIQPGGERSLIVRAGDSVGPRVVGALSAPVVSSETDLTYEAEVLDDGSSRLLVSEGNNSRIILRSGDSLDGGIVTDIHHGYHSAQVDVNGRLALVVELLGDPNGDPTNSLNIVTALVVGIPA